MTSPALSPSSCLIIPFAFASAPECALVWQRLQQGKLSELPHLQRFLLGAQLLDTDSQDEYSLSPPHWRVMARQMGLDSRDGLTPWAAWDQQDTQHAWALITPCHWQVGVDTIHMGNPADLQLSAEESQAFLQAMQPYFAEDGITLMQDKPDEGHVQSQEAPGTPPMDNKPPAWYAHGDVFDGLPTASLDRVVGRNVNPWMPEGAQAAPLRRLQNEMQMLLYTHPLNDARALRGLPAVNSFWISGAGRLPRLHAITPLEAHTLMVTELQTSALAQDWAAWQQAWRTLDASLIKAWVDRAQAGEAVQLVLCGERAAQRWQGGKQGWLGQIKSQLGLSPRNNIVSLL